MGKLSKDEAFERSQALLHACVKRLGGKVEFTVDEITESYGEELLTFFPDGSKRICLKTEDNTVAD